MRHYLNLVEMLLQAWLDQTVLFLALATVKVFFYSRALISMITIVGESSMPLCRRLENVASQLEQAPEQMSKLTSLVLRLLAANFHILVLKMVYLLTQIAKGIISLLLELYLGTLTCLITALVKGTLELVSEILRDITEFVQSTINAVLKEFNSALSSLSSVISGLSSAAGAVESLFMSSPKTSDSSDIKKVNLTVASLKSISIPMKWISEVENVAVEVPDFEDVLSNVTLLITSPITAFSERFANTSFNFTLNKTLLTREKSLAIKEIILQETASTNSTLGVCDEVGIVFDEAVSVTRSMADYIILGLCIGTVLYAVVTWVIAYFHCRKKARLYDTVAELTDPHEVGNSIVRYQHGIMAIFTSNCKPEMQWLFSYVTTPNLRRCLVLGLIGWFLVLLQFITLLQASKILNKILDQGVVSADTRKFADEVSQYLDDAQGSLDGAVDEINQTMFSSLHDTTSTMTSQINFFQDFVNNTINSVFGTSFIGKPLRTIIYCTIGRKMDTIEAGLQWIERNSRFDSPQLDKAYMQQLFVNASSTTAGMLKTQRQTQLLPQDFTSHIMPAIQKIISGQKKNLWVELFIASAFVSVWGIYLVVGLIILAGRRLSVAPAQNRRSVQTISWPSRLCADAQEQYGFPYNDPYGSAAEHASRDHGHERILSEPPSTYLGETGAQKPVHI